MSEQRLAGFFGKIPANGDFVRRRLPSEFVDPWDNWLQESVAASQTALGEAWLNHYLSGPLWRFALSPGICGPEAWAGVLMPSVDSVGRYFPLTVAIPIPAGISPSWACARESAWFTSAENVALSVLDPNVSLDTFDERTRDLTEPFQFDTGQNAPQNASADSSESAKRASNWLLNIPGSGQVSDGLLCLVDALLAERGCDASFWWTDGSNDIAPVLLIGAALPAAEDFAGLLTGQWQQSAWRQQPFVIPYRPDTGATALTPQ